MQSFFIGCCSSWPSSVLFLLACKSSKLHGLSTYEWNIALQVALKQAWGHLSQSWSDLSTSKMDSTTSTKLCQGLQLELWLDAANWLRNLRTKGDLTKRPPMHENVYRVKLQFLISKWVLVKSHSRHRHQICIYVSIMNWLELWL